MSNYQYAFLSEDESRCPIVSYLIAFEDQYIPQENLDDMIFIDTLDDEKSTIRFDFPKLARLKTINKFYIIAQTETVKSEYLKINIIL